MFIRVHSGSQDVFLAVDTLWHQLIHCRLLPTLCRVLLRVVLDVVRDFIIIQVLGWKRGLAVNDRFKVFAHDAYFCLAICFNHCWTNESWCSFVVLIDLVSLLLHLIILLFFTKLTQGGLIGVVQISRNLLLSQTCPDTFNWRLRFLNLIFFFLNRNSFNFFVLCLRNNLFFLTLGLFGLLELLVS